MNPESIFDFASDNTAGICPEAWEALAKVNHSTCASYGDDPTTKEACDTFRDFFEHDCDVYFVFTGTAANSLALSSLCQSFHSVIAHQIAHIETDECGAPEFFSNGSKLLLAGGADGKCDPQEVSRLIHYRTDLHYPKPRALSLSQSTEYGTIYQPEEIQALTEVAHRSGLRVHMDGARFSNALASKKCSPAELSWKAGVDVLCFGGTKLGMGMTEAVVFFDKKMSEDFAWRCKQAGQLSSKMRFASSQWLSMIKGGVWRKYAEHANRMATRLAEGFAEIEGLEILHPVEANAVFLRLSPVVEDRLKSAGWKFYQFIGGGARFMCSWNTDPQKVEALLATAKGQ